MKVGLLWKLVLFKLYSIPVCVVNTTVPVGTEHVGWVTLAVVGTTGAVGTASMVTAPFAELELHVPSKVFLT